MFYYVTPGLFTDGKGKRHIFSMVQYIFNGPVCDIKIKPHVNSKQDRPFFRTSSTTRERIMEVASKYTHAPETNVYPFYLKPLAGNIRVCQGCRGSLRLSDGSIPAPPFDFVVARMEKWSFRDATGARKTPVRPSAAHYHARLACVHAAELSLCFPPSGFRQTLSHFSKRHTCRI